MKKYNSILLAAFLCLCIFQNAYAQSPQLYGVSIDDNQHYLLGKFDTNLADTEVIIDLTASGNVGLQESFELINVDNEALVGYGYDGSGFQFMLYRYDIATQSLNTEAFPGFRTKADMILFDGRIFLPGHLGGVAVMLQIDPATLSYSLVYNFQQSLSVLSGLHNYQGHLYGLVHRDINFILLYEYVPNSGIVELSEIEVGNPPYTFAASVDLQFYEDKCYFASQGDNSTVFEAPLLPQTFITEFIDLQSEGYFATSSIVIRENNIYGTAYGINGPVIYKLSNINNCNSCLSIASDFSNVSDPVLGWQDLLLASDDNIYARLCRFSFPSIGGPDTYISLSPTDVVQELALSPTLMGEGLVCNSISHEFTELSACNCNATTVVDFEDFESNNVSFGPWGIWNSNGSGTLVQLMQPPTPQNSCNGSKSVRLRNWSSTARGIMWTAMNLNNSCSATIGFCYRNEDFSAAESLQVIAVVPAGPGGTPTVIGEFFGNNSGTAVVNIPAFVLQHPGLFALRFMVNGNGVGGEKSYIDDIQINSCPFSPFTGGGNQQQRLSEEVTGLDQNLQVFPNPTSDQINIQLAMPVVEKTEISIIDLNGRILKSRWIDTSSASTENLVFSVVDLADGIYFVQAKNKNINLTERIIIARE